MIRGLVKKIKSMERDFVLFLLVGVFVGIGQSVDGSTINNFLKEKFDILIMQRTMLEMPRELPGLLVFLVIGFLHALGDVRIAAIANILAGFGMFILGMIPYNFYLMILVIFVYSMGQHVYMPLMNTIGMSFANQKQVGRKLGQISAANTAALVLSSAFLWLLFRFFEISYIFSFSFGAIAYFIAAILLFKINPQRTVPMKNRFILRKEYRLYYWLSILYGARKQIFITFAPWVLVDIFQQKVTTMTLLFFLISSLGIVLKPLIGYLIDEVGERLVLAGEAAILIFICLGYAFAEDLLPRYWAIILVSCCYVLDQSLNSVSMARATYLRKIAISEEDVSPTLSLGTSIDHIVSMFIPILGGLVWYGGGSDGYKYVFIGGAIVSVANFISARTIKIKESQASS